MGHIEQRARHGGERPTPRGYPMFQFTTPTDRLNFATGSVRQMAFSAASVWDGHGHDAAIDFASDTASFIADNAGLEGLEDTIASEIDRMAREVFINRYAWDEFILNVRFGDDFIDAAAVRCAF